ncbi:MAG: hypothetical protein EKK71_09375 [Candidatus Competibacteraceae bacterium]|nr:MAG: hypothetical protein EKK71_09375 [Candidatus Competibacteraceae bacterium]
MAMISIRIQREKHATVAKSQDKQPLKQTVAPCPTKSSSQQHPPVAAHQPPATVTTHEQTTVTIDVDLKRKSDHDHEPKHPPAHKHPASGSDSTDD